MARSAEWGRVRDPSLWVGLVSLSRGANSSGSQLVESQQQHQVFILLCLKVFFRVSRRNVFSGTGSSPVTEKHPTLEAAVASGVWFTLGDTWKRPMVVAGA